MSEKKTDEIRIEYAPLTKVLGAVRNPKGHDVGLLHQSINRFSFVEPLVLNETTGRLVAGHGRLETLRQKKASGEKPPGRIVERDGEWYVPIVRGVGFATDAEAEAYLVTSNQTVTAGGWDEGLLAPILAELAAMPEGLVGTGFDGDDVDRMLRDIQKGSAGADAPEPQIDKADELRKRWQTETGQLWSCGAHRILCGDCTKPSDIQRLLAGKQADIVFTDPPYGIGYLPDSKLKALGKLKNDNRDGRWQNYEEFSRFLDAALTKMVEALRPGGCYYVCMGWEHLPDVLAPLAKADARAYTTLVWDRMMPRITSYPQDYIPVNEFIVYGWRRGADRKRTSAGPEQTTIWRFKTEKAADMLHTTQKPVEVPANGLLNSSSRGDLVYDPFCGSGSTIVAAHQTERIGYGCEIDAGYTAVCLERLSALGLKPECVS